MSKRKHKLHLSHPLLGKGQPQFLVTLLNDLNRSFSLDGQGIYRKEELAPDVGTMPEFDPSKWGRSGEFADAYLLNEMLSKYPFEVPGVDRDAVALAKFKDCEAHCALTNTTVGINTADPFSGIGWHAVLETARRKVLHLLGSFSWDLVEDRCAFGPGASTSRPRGSSDAFYKFGHKPDVTPDCALIAWMAVYRQPHWFEVLTGTKPTGVWVEDFHRHPPEEIFNYVPGNRVTTVPKNAKTNRVIAIEPDLNMFLQKGIGSLIRARLRRVRVNLNSQKLNQRLARLGSRNGSLATVDFSSASDTICLRIVEELLPPDWVVALKQVRSPVGTLPDGSKLSYEKISSMGNGFTFELESLIFWALAKSVTELIGVGGIVSVYGDDLIVRPGALDSLKWCFSRAGFTLNEKKSHYSGGFRESCGKHYFYGDDVTPFYIRKRLTTVWDLYSLANNIRRWARCSWGLDSRVREVYHKVVEAIPLHLRYKIPEGLGDVGLISDFDESCPSFDVHLKRLRVVGLLPVTARKSIDGLQVLVKYFNLRRDEPLETGVATIPRTVTTFGVEHRLLVWRWPTYGPWLDDPRMSEWLPAPWLTELGK